ncbi:hypothetical protein [Geoalkalibacter halelectricus]|uniref:Uncharacterized protein n=1 Tax=Geoalkalibacter halelectricus TaxID=2847045 RepID=A0ABY5ZP96_9BACT|nr:hypothetical protein [Geoalkalibacter halelectricus]MDO3379166.1 hypothetical protein [Geoalkalibacter halelectricus]UWZ80926.1 hypothetical protein L9S41_05850 [Geoalkalibacter halelectricus]
MNNRDLNSQSISEVLNACAILWLRLVEIQTGPWQPSPDGIWEVSQATIQLQLKQVLKGEVQQHPGEFFTLSIILRDSLRPQGDPGPWSRQTLSAGQQLVAFCRGATHDARQLLTDENCEQLLPAEIALDDVQRAMALERGRRSAAQILKEARKDADGLRDIFARYVWAKTLSRNEKTLFQAIGLTPLAGEKSSSPAGKKKPAFDVFEQLMGLLAAPQTHERARAAYLDCAMNTVNLLSPTPWQWEKQLIRSLLQLLEKPQAQALHSAIGQVYLPNLLGLRNSAPRYGVEELFAEDEAERLLGVLKQKSFDPVLVHWLERKM